MKVLNETISRRDVLVGSAVVGGLAALGSPAISIAQQGAAPGSGSTQWDELAGLLRGDLVTPSSASYDETRRVWNGMIDSRPAAIARCSGAADVMSVVDYARDNGLGVSVRGGGHNVTGKAVREGAVTIDLGTMNGVWVDPRSRRARVQGGARLGAVDRETLALGLVTPSGTVSTTGVGGLTLGGGFGWLQRKHGLAVDNLVSADVVTADGQFRTASEAENEDLFWALRGGGGNFGVVTSFEFRLHEAEPIVGGLAMYPEAVLRDMLYFFRDYTASAPESVTTMAGAFIGPPGTPVEGQAAGWIAVCHSGDPGEGERLVQPIKNFGPPAMDFIGPTTFTTIQTMFDAGSPAGRRHYWRSNFMRELTDDALDILVARAPELPRPGSMILLEHMGGAIGRIGVNDTAFSNRDALYNVSVLGTWENAGEDAANIAWTRAFGDELKAFSTGGAYVNYMADDEGADTIRASYEANYQRLVDVKRTYDPTNFFSANQNIAP